MITTANVALGVLAGGRGQRVGGRDKAWLPREGRPALDHLLDELGTAGFAQRLASVRLADTRWSERGFTTVHDLRPDQPGPLAGIEALAGACRVPWLLVLPVDVFDLPKNLFDDLAGLAAPQGCWLRDAGGLQPLIGLWPAAELREVAAAALDSGGSAVHRALATLSPAVRDISPGRVGNANTPEAYDVRHES